MTHRPPALVELRHAAAGHLLGWPEPSRAVPDLAAGALTQGLDTPALRMLAGHPRADTQGARLLLAEVTVELGLGAPPIGGSPWQRVRHLLDPVAVHLLEHALAAVQRDLDATLPSVGRLGLLPLPDDGSVAVTLPDGRFGRDGTPGLWAWTEPDPDVLVAVAEETQECLVHVLQVAWPLCPRHHRPLDLDGPTGCPVWRCRGGDGHTVALVGGLGRADG